MEIQAHIICIGNEIMLGHINNTNAQYLSKKLSEIGIRTTKQTSIPDEAKTIISSINNSLNSSNITVLTGGLGPTVDDLTLECISKASGKGLIFNKKVATNIKAHFKKRKIKMPKNNLRQALVPKDANYILNDIGTAPGLFMTLAKGKVLIALPGVPFELYSMFKKGIVPQLKKIFQPDKIIRSRVIKLTGLAESSVDSKIEDLLRSKGNVEMGIYPHPEEISIKITATDETEKKARATIAKIEKKIYSRLKNHIFGYDDETLEGAVGKILLKKKLSLSIAESCTGGLLASRITDVPGSSRYFKIGLVVYSNISKNKSLNIPIKTIKKHGAVSRQIASLMAKNMRVVSNSDIGIGISGIAGPTGGTKKKPVGLVYIALSSKKKSICKEFYFSGQRDIIKHKATQRALSMIRALSL